MKSWKMILCLCFVLVASSSLAHMDSGPNGLGLYADMDGMVNWLETEPGMVEIHLLATNLTEPNISGWEVGLMYYGPIYFAGYNIPYENINVGTFPSFSVGLVEPIPQTPVILLMTITIGVTEVEPVGIYLTETALPEGGSMGNDLPAYATSPSFYLTAFHPSSGSIDAPVFMINGNGPVATEPATWGGVRTLYR